MSSEEQKFLKLALQAVLYACKKAPGGLEKVMLDVENNILFNPIRPKPNDFQAVLDVIKSSMNDVNENDN